MKKTITYESKLIEKPFGYATLKASYIWQHGEIDNFHLFHEGADLTDWVTDAVLSEAFEAVEKEEA